MDINTLKVINFAGFDFTMKSYKSGSDFWGDGNPFSGKIYVNGKYIASCYDSGRGAGTDICPDKANRTLYDEVVAALKSENTEFGLPYTMSIIACMLADNLESIKRIKRNVKTKLTLYNQKEGRIITVPYKMGTKTISPADYSSNEQLMQMVKNTVAKYTVKGFVCCNDLSFL